VAQDTRAPPAIRDKNPVLDDPHTLRLSGERLDKPDEPRPEAALSDFCLSKEWCQLLASLDATGDVMIDRINVSAGIPRRVVFEQRLSGPEIRTIQRGSAVDTRSMSAIDRWSVASAGRGE
jgi:hypothetical protein